MVILNGPDLIEEIKGVPESTLSCVDPIDEVCGANSMLDFGF